MGQLEARRSLGFENEIGCEAKTDTALGRCGGNSFTVYRDKETGKISLVCAWGHITTIFNEEAEG